MKSNKSMPSMDREREKSGPSPNKKLSPLSSTTNSLPHNKLYAPSHSSVVGGDDLTGELMVGNTSSVFLSTPIRHQLVQNPKLALIQAAYHRARTKFEEYQLSPPLALLSRTNSEKASRIYYALFTLFQASISASQTTKIEKYIRTKASTFAKSTFDLKEWNEVMKVARECRTHELEEARNEVRLQEKKLGMQLVSSSAILKTICAECGAFKKIVGQDIADFKGFMQKMKGVVLSTITTFVSKQTSVISQWETSYAAVAQDLALETERSGLLEEQVSTLLDMVERIKLEKLTKTNQIDELIAADKEMKKRIEELEATIEETNKKANKAAREATIKLNSLELHLSNKESECEELTSDLKTANEKIETLNIRIGSSRRSMDDKLETANDTVRQLRVTISNLQNEAQLLDATKSNTALELTQTKEELRESRMTIANSESLIEAALRKQKEVFDAEVIKAAKTAKLYATMAEEEHKTALDSLSQQLQVAQSTATRLTDIETQYQTMRTEQAQWEKDREIMRKQLALAQEKGFVASTPEPASASAPAPEPVAIVLPVEKQLPVDVPAVVVQESPSVQPTAVTEPAVQPDPASDDANQEIVLSDGEDISLPDDVSDLGSEHGGQKSGKDQLSGKELPTTENPNPSSSSRQSSSPDKPKMLGTVPKDLSFVSVQSHQSENSANIQRRQSMDKKSGKSARSSLEKRPSGSLDSPGTGSGKGTGTGAGTGTRAARGSMDSLAIAASALNDPEDFDDGQSVDADFVLTELEDAFLTAAAYNKQPEMLKCLERDPQVIHVKNGFGRDAMQIAARNGNVQVMEFLLSNGGLLTTRGNKGDTLWHLAAYYGQLKVCKWLRKKHAFDVAKLLTSEDQSVMHVAAKRSELEILQFMQDIVGYDVRIQDKAGLNVFKSIPRFGDDKERNDACRSFVQQIANDLDRVDKQREDASNKKAKKQTEDGSSEKNDEIQKL